VVLQLEEDNELDGKYSGQQQQQPPRDDRGARIRRPGCHAWFAHEIARFG